jgi:glycogen debranching enzyme
MNGLNAHTSLGLSESGAVTVLESTTFCVSAGNGDMHPGRAHGVFFQDTRILSRWRLLVDDLPAIGLTAISSAPFRARFIGRTVPTIDAEDTLLIERDRLVANGLRESITLRNYGPRTQRCQVVLYVGSDFADLFAVKEGRQTPHSLVTGYVANDELVSDTWLHGLHRGTVVHARADGIEPGRLWFDAQVAPGDSWSTTIEVDPVVDHRRRHSDFPEGVPLEQTAPARRLSDWHQRVPSTVGLETPVVDILRQCRRDLGALRIVDPHDPSRAVLAAGAPWFMALFGRDALLTSYMALGLDPSLAVGTLQTLADRQGRIEDNATEEQPGRILHEVRFGGDVSLPLGGGQAYYGTVDATPLFVITLAEAARWGIDPSVIDSLLPAADRALDWVERSRESDAHSLLSYQRRNESGLVNQGWKDSWNAINYANGALAEAPIALSEVQGYVYDAYLARAELAMLRGDTATAQHWTDRARELQDLFEEAFWMPEHGYYALAIDGSGRQVDACTSNMGHCLWSGIVPDERAKVVADRLLADDMFSGWGVRTLAEGMGAYDPVSYHNGSVWPHDNALIISGLIRYRLVDHAHALSMGILDAARHFRGRLPELFSGLPRGDYPEPVPYPTSCSPQAWAAATPLQVIRALLGFDPDLPQNRVRLNPQLPASMGPLRIDRLALGPHRLTVDGNGQDGHLSGLPPTVRVVH